MILITEEDFIVVFFIVIIQQQFAGVSGRSIVLVLFSLFSFQEKDPLSSIFYSPLAIFSTPLLFTRARSLRTVEKDCSLILLSL